MSSLFTPSPATSTTTSASNTQYNPSNTVEQQWIGPTGLLSTAGGLANYAVNNYLYPGQMVAGPSDLTNQYWQQAGGLGGAAPNVMGNVNQMTGYSGDLYNTQQNPQGINLPGYNPQSFQPGQLNIPAFGATPNVTAPTGPSGLASSYLVNPQQVSAMQVSAPQAYTPQQVSAMQVAPTGTVNPITGVQNVNAPLLQQFQMSTGNIPNVKAPTLQDYSMQAAANVAPSGLASTQSWTAPGTSQQYMSPYVQNVVNTQLAQAQVQEQQQLGMQAAQAAQAGAFGGSRQAVEAANTSLGYQQQAQALQAQGLQSAYAQGMQQFQAEQGLGLQAQQTNIQAGLQAALANQQAQQQANTQNLAAQLQTQGLGTQASLQAQLANQQTAYGIAGQNLSALLGTQQLGATTGLQAGLANQQMNYQQQLANQQAQEFGLGQSLQSQLANQATGLQAQGMNQQAGLQAGLAEMGYQMQAQQLNQSAGLQAALANQQAGITTGLAAQQLGFQGAQFNASQQQQAAMANQAAQMQAMGMTYQGGLSGALQTQNLGLSGAEFGGNLGLQSAAQQAQLQQAQQGLNMQAINNAGAMSAQGQQLALQGYQGQLAGLGATAAAAQSQQGYQQQLADAQYQQWMSQFQIPMQAEGWLAGLTAMQPLPYQMYNTGTSTTTGMPAQPSILQQGLTAGLGAAGLAGFFSDVRMKEDIRPVGTLADIPIYSYRFKGLPGTMVGPMAQEVFTRWPEAVIPGNESQPWMIDPARFMARVEAHGLSKVIEMTRRREPRGLGHFAMAA